MKQKFGEEALNESESSSSESEDEDARVNKIIILQKFFTSTGKKHSIEMLLDLVNYLDFLFPPDDKSFSEK